MLSVCVLDAHLTFINTRGEMLGDAYGWRQWQARAQQCAELGPRTGLQGTGGPPFCRESECYLSLVEKGACVPC